MREVVATVVLVSKAGTRVTVAAADEDVWTARGFNRPPARPRRAAKRTTDDD